MKIKLLICIAVIMFAAATSFSQSITPDVIASAGDYFSSPSGSISWTIGEPVIDTYYGTTNIVTKGFQQPLHISTTAVAETSDPGDLLVYPNPFTNELQLDLSGLQSGEYSIELFDAAGKNVFSSEKTVNASESKQTLNMETYAHGLYILKVTCKDNAVFKFFRVSKL